MLTLDQRPITDLKGVGASLAETLARLQIFTIQDLLFHVPFRYQDRTRVIPIADLRLGEQCVVEGEVSSSRVVMGRRRSLQVQIRDHTGAISLRFFHFNAAQQKQFETGRQVRCFGEVRRGQSGFELYHPEYKLVADLQNDPLAESLTPIYHLTEGIQQPRLRALCEQALAQHTRCPIVECIPPELLADYRLPTLNEAIRYLHAPPANADVQAMLDGRHPCQQRLVMEELLAHHLSLQKLRQSAQAEPAHPLQGDGRLRQALLAQLPFSLTGAQQHVLREISADLAKSMPMLRLVQGDVGSGKTIVAAMAALQAVEMGLQVALMAPTEILAEQHWQNFAAWLEPMGLNLAWLSGKSKGKTREQTLERIARGEAQIVIGTHALFQEDVQFHALALVIVDEQHRFGVHQRLALREKGGHLGRAAHQLIMTATPIPRTLAMSAYADLDTSVIDELPPGRQPIETVVIPDTRRPQVIDRVRVACQEGRQAYWVCTLIEESETLQCQAAEATLAELSEALPELKVGLVHGRMKGADKVAVMQAFKNGTLDLLVATTVIEVGVDVPNASLIIIENPERLGLAQLHQLRGRVGRGDIASFCVLLYHPPLSQNGKARLAVMRESNDGFVIAEQDLAIRGPGEVLGTRQTGVLSFRLADLQRDEHWLTEVRRLAPVVMHKPHLADELIRRWLGQNIQYGVV